MYICYFHLLRFKKERIFKKTKLSQIPFIISISFFDLSVENYYFFVIFFSLTFETWRKWKKAPQSIHLWQRFDSSKSHILRDQPTRSDWPRKPCDGNGRNLRTCQNVVRTRTARGSRFRRHRWIKRNARSFGSCHHKVISVVI